MKKILYILLFGSLIFGSCAKNTNKETDNIRFMFDPGDLQFISSSFNPAMQTMSALYGNSTAILLLSNPQQPQQHASLKLVTYRMQDDPNYFGSKVNGELILVETLKPGPDGVLEYHTEFGQIPTNQSREQRIAHILDSKPIAFPQ
ncbi:MAG: hypothetical protein K0S24_149 [Sphingobacterium sp.]|jgi:hypothetical protein|nr:hypothetical protein [Sphingobacterium sp.]